MKFESRGPSKQEFPKMFAAAAAKQISGITRQAATGSLEN
jgi:hypothetical protein